MQAFFIMGNTIQVDIPVISAEQAELCIAELSEINFYAFQEDTVLSAFIEEALFEEKSLKAVLSKLHLGHTTTTIAHTNWNRKWESEFMPAVVDTFVAVRAPFHLPVNGVAHEIIITPKMSFGTGHHATTFLMLQQMQKIAFTGKKVLDFGTGTGLLAILAKKLGAATITALDNDPSCITNAAENFVENSCDGIRLFQNDSIAGLGKFDVVLANINLNVIMQNIESLREASHADTCLLVSGFLTGDLAVIEDFFGRKGFRCDAAVQKDGWLCCRFSVQ